MNAILALADGMILQGKSIGIEGSVVGEVVFNTAMTGYQEIITDPSYASQIISFTCPHIGNTGINFVDSESAKIWAAGIVIKENTITASNWRSKLSFTNWLQQHNVIAISGINTRLLTKHIRDNGSQYGCIMAGVVDEELAISKARNFTAYHTMELIAKVTTSKAYPFTLATQSASKAYPFTLATKPAIIHKQSRQADQQPITANAVTTRDYKVVVIDFGVKQSILTKLANHNCSIIVVPAYMPAAEILRLQPNGILLSNGPGDPNEAIDFLANIKELSNTNLPILGICLGFQLLVLAFGGKIAKMRFGHHGANHPVQDIATGRVLITSQNHNYAMAEDPIPKELVITHRSLFDQSIQGIRHIAKPIYGYQWHPEAGPGPLDSTAIFQQFIALMRNKVCYAKTYGI